MRCPWALQRERSVHNFWDYFSFFSFFWVTYFLNFEWGLKSQNLFWVNTILGPPQGFTEPNPIFETDKFGTFNLTPDFSKEEFGSVNRTPNFKEK